MFTPTHFVDTDERSAKINCVENGQLVQEVRRNHTAVTRNVIVDVLTEDGEQRGLFLHRLVEFDPAAHKVTCDYGDWEHSLDDCRGARVVKPEPAEEVDGVEALRVYLRSLRDALDKIADSVATVERTLGETQ